MPYWMTGEHGTHVCYDRGDMQKHLSLGWKLLNEGESPDYSKSQPVAQQSANPPSTSLAPDQVADAQAESQKDILDLPVVQIQPQLQGMSKLELEALRARELNATTHKPRKGLISILDEMLEG